MSDDSIKSDDEAVKKKQKFRTLITQVIQEKISKFYYTKNNS